MIKTQTHVFLLIAVLLVQGSSSFEFEMTCPVPAAPPLITAPALPVKECLSGLTASRRFSRRLSVMLYYEKGVYEDGIDQLNCISSYLLKHTSIRNVCMHKSLKEEFKKSFYEVHLKGPKYYQKLRREKRIEKYEELKNHILWDK